MNIGALLESVIYLISSSMLYPALVLLVVGFVAVVVSLGASVAEWAERARNSKRLKAGQSPGLLGNGGHDGAMGGVLKELDGILSTPGVTWDDVENLWRNFKRARRRKLDYLRILARLGPAMGLVGTLIPMSTGLASLTQGDTSRLSSDLVVAFSTTVVGLCSGVAAYVLHLVRSGWLEGELETAQLVIESRAARVLDERGERGGGETRAQA
ncbi:MAG: MotA/TolQ/ExbB proton channel family protein [Synergistaceae bacterium]|jgi:hypothetical protein|nr:MotA/TolQ/ExbB proton channel family protein [Synergistaceae bacterium]